MNSLAILFIKGLLFGMTMAIIPGPIFFLIVQRTLAEGAIIGFFCGLGAITADVIYALIAAIGLTFVTQALMTHQALIAFVGSIFLFYLGITTFRRQPIPYTAALLQKKSIFKACLSTFLLTLANPITIISYTVIFAGLGIGFCDLISSIMLVIGVFTGAITIVIALVGFLRLFHKRLSTAWLSVINKIAGSLLMCFGVLAFIRAWF